MGLVLYTTKTCAWCQTVKKYLTMKKKDYVEVDVTDNAEERQFIINTTKQTTVPILFNTDTNEYVAGWNVGKINQLIS